LGVAVARLLSKIVSLGLSALQVWVPAAVLYLAYPRRAHADDFMDAARQGQTFGLGILPNASNLGGKDADGNIQLNWKGNTTTITPQQLFPDTQNTTDPGAQSTYGKDAEVKNQANTAVQDMTNSLSMTGQAYQTLNSSANRAHVDISNSDIWLQTDYTLTQALSQAASTNCAAVTTVNPNATTARVADYRTCERIVYPGSTCHCRHDYTIELLGYYIVAVNGLSAGNFGITVDLKTGQVISSWGCASPQVITYVASAPPPDACDAPATGANKVVSYFQKYPYTYLTQSPTCSNNFQASFGIFRESEDPEWVPTGALMVGIYHIVDNGWACDPGCEVLLTNPDGDNFVKPTPECTTKQVCEPVMTGIDPDTGLPIYEDQCHEETTCTNPYSCTLGSNADCEFFSGSKFCQGDLPSSNPFATKGISNLCQEVTVDLGTNNFNAGQMNCWTDPQGVVHCPTVTGDQKDTCGELEDNPACLYIRQECIDGAQDPASGVCYAFNVVFDCGQDVPVSGQQTTTGYVCDGILRCMGEGCISGQFDPNNTDFPKAAAALQMAQYAQQDLDCGYPSAGVCTLFKGTHMECKKALGGYIVPIRKDTFSD
jgi:conjugal transfer mating pair stabilization protein TraN